MTTPWPPYREPLRATLLRTGLIAIAIGAALARFQGGLARWPLDTLAALWPSFAGHWLEVWFLNWLRPRLSPARPVQVAARLAVWFAGGVVFAACMELTLRPRHWPAWWICGLAFIGIELVAHLAMRLRGRSSFYDGRG
jgi:hypothetical protein